MSDNPTGEPSASHEGTGPSKPPLIITEEQLDQLIANTAHLVLYKLRKEMHREINKQVERLRIDFESQRTETREQIAGLLKNHVYLETIL